MTESDAPDITLLTDIMARLRHPQLGCAWDLKQDFATIAPYTIEEAYEVADAIARNDMEALSDELGDLLLQVVFHSRMAEECGYFSLQTVILGICDKMTRRHPHIFGEEDGEFPGWENIKAAERQNLADKSAMAGVAVALPALLRAEKLQKRAARVGFDWPDTQGVMEKINEEIEEVVSASSQAEKEEEVGDLLFAVVNLARHLKVDAEQALRAANVKFEQRFRLMEEIAGPEFPELSLAEQESCWQRAKAKAQSRDRNRA
ncbi:nucleoside triphosphate pyrophosphohydrolase [Rhizorhapis suberifaciens]|uniref:Nucleoside triphosphate pyrophosphohydrolase n=1 Tax=Rhizorhapis suberifaciens TaxID=13656 RepID=A0A840HY14_9SPHN|nr:nucleoside triphosphate pyrophosphohydrolase [Rhizorhapis suberifaciens]MBB4642284.1 ATP diphosphatase [Rhizorhapis suberifaciens]